MKEQNGEDTSSLLNNLSKVNRDNSRTMMQWDNRAYAGFSTTEPWFHVNPNYKTINVADQLEDEHSVLNYYKRLVQLKKITTYLITVNTN